MATKVDHFSAVIMLAIMFLSEPSLPGLTVLVNPIPTVNGIIVGPIRFVETYLLVGENQERRMPRVGEEFRVTVRVRNEGSATIYYLPTLCDSSLSATFDPYYVRVETGRPRCLAASMPTPLETGEEAVVSAPESGTAYVAIRQGSTTVTVVFAYSTDASMTRSAQQEARNRIPFTVQDASQEFPIPGFPVESMILGFALAFAIMISMKKRKERAVP